MNLSTWKEIGAKLWGNNGLPETLYSVSNEDQSREPNMMTILNDGQEIFLYEFGFEFKSFNESLEY